MPSSTCCVPFCSSGYPSTRKKNRKQNLPNPSMFLMPKDPIMFRKWERRIDRKDRKLTPKDTVCSLHFQVEFIKTTYPKLTMPDGSTFEMKLGKTILRKDAVPSIFPNEYPKYKRVEFPTPRKPPKRRNTSDLDGLSALKRSKISNGWAGWDITVPANTSSCKFDVDETSCETTEELRHSTKNLTYENFICILKIRPIHNWELLVSQYTGCIQLLQIDPSNFVITKRIIITEKLKVQVFLGNTNVKMEEMMLHTEDDLLSLVKSVEKMQPCPGRNILGEAHEFKYLEISPSPYRAEPSNFFPVRPYTGREAFIILHELHEGDMKEYEGHMIE